VKFSWWFATIVEASRVQDEYPGCVFWQSIQEARAGAALHLLIKGTAVGGLVTHAAQIREWSISEAVNIALDSRPIGLPS
jgi:hypothetical protein